MPRTEYLYILLFFLIYLTPAMAYSSDFEGPLKIKNGHPLYLAIGVPSILSAEPEDSFSVGYAYSNVLKTGTGKWESIIDMDTEVIDIRVTKAINSSTEASINIPWMRYSSGNSDLLVDKFHSAFGFPNEGKRKYRSKNEYAFYVKKDNKEYFLEEPADGFADITIAVKKVVYNKEPTIGISAFLNLPSGDPERAFGSGETNGGVSILLNKKLGRSSMLYVNGGLGVINQLKAVEDIPLRNYLYGGFDLEYAYSKKISFNMQMFLQESPFSAYFIHDYLKIISGGGRYRFENRSSIGFSFSEDIPEEIDNAGTTDFTFKTEYQKKFN